MSKNTQTSLLNNSIYIDPTTLNIGIGNLAPNGYKLDVTGTGRFTGALTGTSATFSGQVIANLNTTGTPLRIDVANGTGVTSNTKFAIGTGGQYGTSTNKKFLDIDFNGYNNYTQARIRSWDENGTTGYGSLYFYTNSTGGTDATTLAMALNYNGNVGIGTSSAGRTLQVESSTVGSFSVHNTRNVSGDFATILQLGGGNTNNTSSYYLYCDTDSVGVRMVVYGNGNIANVNNSYGAYSDFKLKENIVDATPKLNDLLKVKIRNYNLIADETKTKQIGVIAQELEEIFPNMIEESPDRDIDNNDLGTTTKNVKYSVFVPMLIKAIQELSAKLDLATSEIEILKNK